MVRWLASRPRVTGAVLAAAGWAATLAAVIAGRHLGRGAAVQIIFAATMITFAMAETLLSPASPVIIDDRTRPAAAGRYNRLGTAALITGCMLGPPAGGTALGAGWATSLLTSLAVACALASIAVRRPGRQLESGANRIQVAGGHPVTAPAKRVAQNPCDQRPDASCGNEQLPPAKRIWVHDGLMEVDRVRP